MPSRKKIDWEKVQAALTTTCPKCGRVIQPEEIRRVNFEEMIRPESGARFQPRKFGDAVRKSAQTAA